MRTIAPGLGGPGCIVGGRFVQSMAVLIWWSDLSSIPWTSEEFASATITCNCNCVDTDGVLCIQRKDVPIFSVLSTATMYWLRITCVNISVCDVSDWFWKGKDLVRAIFD